MAFPETPTINKPSGVVATLRITFHDIEPDFLPIVVDQPSGVR